MLFIFTIFFATVITVGLEETLYETEEGDVEVEVCTVIINGTLERRAIVFLQTEESRATGKT